MSSGAEFLEVEQPFIDQLVSMGWNFVTGNKHEPSVTGRESFREVLLRQDLAKSLRRINLRDGEQWLDESRIAEAVGQIERVASAKLLEANQAVTKLMLEGCTVSGVADWDQGRTQTIQFFDWDDVDNNLFLAINQFRVDEPGGQGRRYVLPDIVLFVNGIPLVVVECKSPYLGSPMAEAIEQIRRYSNQRSIGVPEGNERLFWSNQFNIATYGDKARVGTFTSSPDHFSPWIDPSPRTRDELAAQRRKTIESLTGQETLIAGMLSKQHLLDIVRHFVIFKSEKSTVKIACRYQQYRAVKKAIARLKSGSKKSDGSETDQRGGIIWHTQGSGKSLTMAFLVRAMRSDPELRRFKVVVVTDRTDLEDQLSAEAAASGETTYRAKDGNRAKALLKQSGPALVFTMIQKMNGDDETEDDLDIIGDDEVWNEDDSILILVDEAHRSHTNTLHARLEKALPNAAQIGFTGTPILRDDKVRTEKIFGDFIDRYTIRESEADGATVPILYEGKAAKGAVRGASDMDALFEDMFAEHSQAEIEELKKRYATKGNILESKAMIADKARSMLLHYVAEILPDGFKAQVVAVSRKAAVRYGEAFDQARNQLIADIEALPSTILDGFAEGTLDVDTLNRQEQVLVRASVHLAILREMKFVPVISGSTNDEGWSEWTDKAKQKATIERFKKPLGPQTEHSDPVAFIIVKSMLLTGFDAPIEGVMYLDRMLKDAELLQAIARVNRTYPSKAAGKIVDYYGITNQLKKALVAYASEDAQDTLGAMQSIIEQLPKLADRHARVRGVFTHAGLDDFSSSAGIEACVQLLADEQLRMQFETYLKRFLATLGAVLPRADALPYVKDAKKFAEIQVKARRRYRESELGDFDPSLYSGKVRELIDEHMTVLDLHSKIPPVSITDPNFAKAVSGLTSPRAQASEMEHALRYHIRKHFDEDPARYTRLSDHLEEVLKRLNEQWDQLVLELHDLTEELAKESSTPDESADPIVSRFYGLLESEFATTASLPAEQGSMLLKSAKDIVAKFRLEVARVDFWRNPVAQDDVRRWVVTFLDDHDLFDLSAQAGVADRLMELAKANAALLTQTKR